MLRSDSIQTTVPSNTLHLSGDSWELSPVSKRRKTPEYEMRIKLRLNAAVSIDKADSIEENFHTTVAECNDAVPLMTSMNAHTPHEELLV
jgi:hypothetical protein